jgi:hypothetical protein
MGPPPRMPTPDTLKGVDDLIRSGLEAYRESWFAWLLVSTALVVVGLWFEFPEIWHESVEALSSLRSSPKPRREISPWMKLAGTLGWVLIVVGVTGEFVADSFVSKADGFVQKFDEILLADAQRGSSLARERAAAAYERAVVTEHEAAEENRLASESLDAAENARLKAEAARAKAEGLELQIAQSNERAAHAEQQAEEEHAARTKLEQKLTWRSVTNEQAERIARKLRPFPGQQFDFVTYNNEGECLNFQNVLYRLFLHSGWTLDPKRQWGMLITLIVGLEVEISEGADEQVNHAASTLVKALNDENILATLKPIPVKDAPTTAVIKIAVGKSPVSMEPIE